jgi:hypothetical protein
LPKKQKLLLLNAAMSVVASGGRTAVKKTDRATFSLRFHCRSPLLFLLSRHRHGFFFDFFRPCPSVVMSGALQ